MPRAHFSLSMLALLLTTLVLVASNADAVWSISVDLAHHYALTYRIAEIWQLVPNDPTLGEMNVYPRLSHWLAAVTGMVFGSSFLGLQLVTLASLALTWAGFFAVLYTLPSRSAAPAALVLAVLVWLNHRYLGFDLHGAEIVGNFFFSQLFAQAICILAIAFAIRLDMRGPRLHVYAFLLLAGFVVIQAHLLAALELLAVLVGIVALDHLTLKGPRRARQTALSIGVIGAAIAGVVLSPSFSAMRQISENNGRLVLHHLDSASALAMLAVAGLVAAAVLLYLWLRGGERHPAFKFMASYGGAISGLCLLQSVLLRFGQGSEYAVKKYAFGISSFVLLALAMVVGARLARFWASRARPVPASDAALPAPLCAAVAAAALAVTFNASTHADKKADASDIATLERRLLLLRDTTLPEPVPGKTDMVIDLAGQSDTVNYMFAIGIFHTPRAVAGPDLLLGYKLGPFDQYRTIVSSRQSSRYAGRDCSPSTGALLAIDAACLKKAVIAASICRQTLDFSARADLESGMLTGFSVAEQEGRWTDGPQASVTCTVEKPFTKATLSLAPFLAGGHPRQRVAVSVNGAPPVQRELGAPGGKASIEVPLPPVAAGQQMVFTIETPDAVSPQQLGLGADGRRLGITLRTIAFE